MPEEASDFAQANVRRFKLDVNKDAEQTLKKVLERRNNDEVVQHLEDAGNKPENYQVTFFCIFRSYFTKPFSVRRAPADLQQRPQYSESSS